MWSISAISAGLELGIAGRHFALLFGHFSRLAGPADSSLAYRIVGTKVGRPGRADKRASGA